MGITLTPVSEIPNNTKFPVKEEHMKSIAKIILNWGKADTFLGLCLEHIYKIPEEDSGDLLHVLDIKKKVDYLKKKTKKKPPSPNFDKLITEMNYCMKEFKWERDTIAHGTLIHPHNGSEPVFLSMKNTDKKIRLSELSPVVKRSKYALIVSAAILFTVLGKKPEPLPQRPA